MMDDLESIRRFIGNEKEVSLAKISFLKRSLNLSPYKKRIVNIEEGFLSFPFEDLGLSSLDETREAVSLFRSSRAIFCIKYGVEYEDYTSSTDISDRPMHEYPGLMLAARKLDYVLGLSHFLKFIKPQEINPVQNEDIFKIYSEYISRKNNKPLDDVRASLSSMSIDDLLDSEPVMVSRARARMQVISYSSGLYLDDALSSSDNDILKRVMKYNGGYYNKSSIKKDLCLNNVSDISLAKLSNSLEMLLDSLMAGLGSNGFKFYNKAISIIGNMDGTMGLNYSIEKVRPMQDIFSKSHFKNGFVISIPNVESSIECLKVSEISNTGRIKCGVVLPISRVGNEKMDIFYKKIIISGVDISSYFNDRCSNVVASKDGEGADYCKAVLIRKEFAHNVGSIIPTGESLLDQDYSRCLVSKTRSENDFVKRALKYMSSYFEVAKNDYLLINENTINSRIDRMKVRKDLMSKISGKMI